MIEHQMKMQMILQTFQQKEQQADAATASISGVHERSPSTAAVNKTCDKSFHRKWESVGMRVWGKGEFRFCKMGSRDDPNILFLTFERISTGWNEGYWPYSQILILQKKPKPRIWH